MFKIGIQKFYPLAGDLDFCVELKVLSFEQHQEITLKTFGHEPSGGPEAKDDPKEVVKRHTEFIKALLEASIVSVSGCEVNGVPETDVKKLMGQWPYYVVDAISKEVLKISRAPDAEIKNS